MSFKNRIRQFVLGVESFQRLVQENNILYSKIIKTEISNNNLYSKERLKSIYNKNLSLIQNHPYNGYEKSYMYKSIFQNRKR